MPFDLRELERRYALAEAVALDTCLRGSSELPDDADLEAGLVAVLPASWCRPALVVFSSRAGRGWWLVGVSGGRPRFERHSWPFLVGFAGWERIDREAEALSQGRGR